MLFLILGYPIVPCDSTTPGLHKTGFGMFGIENLSWFDSVHMWVVWSNLALEKKKMEILELESQAHEIKSK